MTKQNLMPWVEKYRPSKIDDCILPDSIKEIFKGIVSTGEVPNLILNGNAGMGKTTIAKALCSELGYDFMMINASDERKIDDVRYKVKPYASSVSLLGTRKVIIFDEADNFTPDSQAALKALIEEFANNCSFIFTCNHKNKIINPIHSRCSTIDFRFKKTDRPALAKQFVDRITNILNEEQTEFNKKVILDVVIKFFPDFRRTINELQTYSRRNGTIDDGILYQSDDLNFKDLILALKERKFKAVEKWASDNSDNEIYYLYEQLYTNLKPHLKDASIPILVELMGDYQWRTAFAVDHHIMLLAFLTNILAECELK